MIVKGVKQEATITYIGHVRKEFLKLLKKRIGMGHKD